MLPDSIRTHSSASSQNRLVPPHQNTKLSKWRSLGFKAQAVAVAIAVGTLPVIANQSAHASTPRRAAEICSGCSRQAQDTIAQAVETDVEPDFTDERELESESNRPSLILWIEIAVAILLLISLVSAFLANRAARQIPNQEDDDESSEGTDLTWESLTQDSSPEQSIPEQARVLEQLNAAIVGHPDSFESTPTESQSRSVAALQETQDVPLLSAIEKTPTDKINFIEQHEETEQEQLLATISLRLRKAICLEDLFKTAVKEVRRALRTERVIILGFDSSVWNGTVVAESVAPGLPQTLRVKIDDPCFRDGFIDMYKQGRVRATNDVYQDPNLTDCYLRTLEQFAVKASLVAPILKNDQLLGLLIAHHCSEARTWHKSEIDSFANLATQIGLATDEVSFLEQQEEEVEQAQLLTEIGLRLRQSLSMEDLLRTTVKEVRYALRIDRVIILGFDPTSSTGVVVAESVAPGLPQTLRVKIDDPCLRNGFIEMYQQGRVRVINDVYQDPDLTDCYLRTLEQFAVKAIIVAPILKNKQLLGLLIAHHCSEPRTWQKSEVSLFTQMATQVGFAVDRVNLLEQSQ